jgi:haloalkane dehalogenase
LVGPHLVHAAPYLREVEANLGKLADRPTLIVWGEADFAFHGNSRERFETAFPHHQTILYPNASHFLQEDVGDHIAEAFKRFRGPRS